jgi:oxygen-dependent protoporphyrinogen oxidase
MPGGSIRPLRITVIGSGASGLAAAFRLQQAGHRVRILEQSDRIGSTLRSRREHGFLLDQGAFFLTGAHTRMLRIVEEAGMLDQLVAGKLVIGTLRDGEVHELTGDRFAGRKPGRRLAEYLTGSSPRAFAAASPDSRSPVELLSAIRLLAGAQLVAFRGGMSTYPERLAERFEVELRAEALEVVEEAGHVTVTWRDAGAHQRIEPVDAVVLAVPAAAARKLLPGLDEWRSGFLAEARPGHVINVNVAGSWAPRDIGATYVQIPGDAHPFLSGIVFDHNKTPGRAPPGAGLLSLIALGDWSEAHRDDDDDQVGRELLGALESVLPGAIHDVCIVQVNRWSQHLLPTEHYRRLDRFHELCESQDRRVQLAGDLHTPQNLESATAAGEQAARRLLAALSRRRDGAGARAEAMRQAARRSRGPRDVDGIYGGGH